MTTQSNKLGMTMRYPATRWQDALPTGSGIVGALVYGNIESDTIILNHDSLYYPLEKPQTVDVSDKLPEMRKLVLEGKSKDAAVLMRQAFDERLDPDGGPAGNTAPYQPFCSVHLESETGGAFSNYRRGVDFSNGRAWVQWDDNRGTFTRETFVSRTTDTVYLRIRGDKPGMVSCRLALEPTRSEQLNEKDICHSTSLDKQASAVCTAFSETQTVSFVGTYPGGLTYGAVGHVSTNGSVEVDEHVLVIRDADELTFRIRLFLDESRDAAVSRLTDELLAQSETYEDAFVEHARRHSELFNRFELEIGDDLRLSNEEMLLDAYDGAVSSALLKTMVDYGRYLLICSSRSGGWPANLQGIWNGDYSPAWNCDIHTDENIQMNYWLALPSGLSETMLQFFEYFESFMDDFRENAKNNYGCRGIHMPLAMTTHGLCSPNTYGFWVSAAGWIAQHFYDYYLFTGDTAFLRDRAVPFLKEIALFYEDFLVEGDDGTLNVVPSYSPENRPANLNSVVTINATMDVAVCKEVLANLCTACEILSIEPESVLRWRGMVAKLPEYTVNEDGALREWLHPAYDENYRHRHQSHLYPIFPGLEVTEESDPDIYEAGRIAVEKRMVVGLTKQSGWSMAHMANSYARLGQGDRALEALEILIRASTGPNLFTYHNDWRKMGLSLGGDGMPPFQIDANFGIAAAVMEILVFSKPGLVKLLPALPQKWTLGEVKGIRCRGGITVDMAWNTETETFTAKLISETDQAIRLRVPEFVGQVSLEPASSASPDAAKNYWNMTLEAGIPMTISTGR